MKNSTERLNAKMKRLKCEERALVSAMVKLRDVKHKLKVEELSIIAELRARSMQAAQPLAQTSLDRPAHQAEGVSSAAHRQAEGGSQPSVADSVHVPAQQHGQPQLQLDVPTAGHSDYEEEDDDDDDYDDMDI